MRNDKATITYRVDRRCYDPRWAKYENEAVDFDTLDDALTHMKKHVKGWPDPGIEFEYYEVLTRITDDGYGVKQYALLAVCDVRKGEISWSLNTGAKEFAGHGLVIE